MITRTIKTVLAVTACTLLIVGGAYVFRESLLRAGINAFLADDITVTQLSGVRLSATHAGIDELDLHLGASGQQLTVAGIELSFSMQGLFSKPVMENLTIASARLTDAAGNVGNIDNSPVTADIDTPQAELLLSDVLKQLRAFPLANIELTELQVPQLKQKLALHVAQQTDGLQLRLVSGALHLQATFSQQSADTIAQVAVRLDVDDTTVAEGAVSLQPQTLGYQVSGYQIQGSGKLEFSDANTPFAEYLTTPLPLSSVALTWNLVADVSDAVSSNPASNINLSIVPGSRLVLREGLLPELGALVMDFPERAELRLVPGAAMNITGTIPLRVAGSWQQQALHSAMILTLAECGTGDVLECSVGFDGAVDLAAYIMPGADPAAATTLTALAFSGSGNAKISGDDLTVTVNSSSRLSAGELAASAYIITALNVATESALTLSSSLVDQQMRGAGDQLTLTFAELTAGGYQANGGFVVRDFSFASAENLAGKIHVQTVGLVVTGPHWLPAVGLAADISIDGDMLAFNTPLLLPNAPTDAQLHASGSYNLETGTGKLKMRLPPLILTGVGNSLSSYLDGWPYPADVMTGTLALDLDVQVQPGMAANAPTDDAEAGMKITGTTKIVLTDVAGFYEENFFRGLHTTFAADYDSAAVVLPVSTPPLAFTVDEINVGLPITDVALNYQLDAGSHIMNVSSISGAVLDGTVSGMDISYDFSKERNDMLLLFAGLRLERMLELADYNGIEAMGAVSGELPVSITAGKIEVAAGRLYAEMPGGSIRYLDAPPAGQGNPAMDLVNQALSNYQFQSLESTIDYTPDGELLLGMQLRGHNPDMNGGQAINLNLNISDNIPTLLRSLQAGRAIEDFLQEQYQ